LAGYSADMRRFAPSQPDLFAPRQPDLFASATPPPPAQAPLDELADLLAMLRAADRLPWPDAATAMTEERRILGLARGAGPEGEKLAAAIMDETERLFAADERRAMSPRPAEVDRSDRPRPT
jgi:hypothetical protein